jgi:type I restriction enzyme R subunit
MPSRTIDSAVKLLGDETLGKIAQELTTRIHKNVTLVLDHEGNRSRAKLRSYGLKRILRKLQIRPDKQEGPPKRSSSRQSSSAAK